MKQLLFLFYILIFNTLQAQVKISGHIYDQSDASPLPNVNICELATANCAVTDFDGKFEIIVKDSLAVLDISYIGYKGIKIKVKDYKGEDIYLEEGGIIEIDYIFTDRIHFGYYADLNIFPYGINFYYDIPFKLSGAIFYKTDFYSNYDLTFRLDKIRINEINFQKNITPSLIFQKRKYYDLNINDYKLVFSNPLKIITPKAGFALKYDYQTETLDKAVILGVSKYIQPTLSKIYSNICLYNDFSEFNIGIEQRLTNKETMWQNFSFGMIYQKYREYDELNLFLNYEFYCPHSLNRGF